MLKKIPIVLILILYIIAFLMSFPYILEGFNDGKKIDTLRSIIEYSTMFSSFLIFNAILLKNKYTSVLAYLLCFILGLNVLISFSSYFIYKAGFNTGMAISILESNFEEAKSMSYMFYTPILSLVCFLALTYYTIFYLKNKIRKYNTKFIIFFASLWILMPFTFFLKHKYVSNKGGGRVIKNVYYHFSDFVGAYKLQQEINSIKTIKPIFNIKKNQPGVKNIVVIIGESVRKQNMSLYGYTKKTTPLTDVEKDRMLIYDSAISPAGITNLSVPLSLSSIKPEEFKTNYNKISYNIISLANQINYKTYWISTQVGAKGITAIASMSNNIKWLNGYDEIVVQELKKTIENKSNNKLIVVHIIGSHPNPCDRIPENWKIRDFDCYDRSIAYTDSILGNIYRIIKNTNSVLIYFSDHGLKIKDGKLLHTDSKESTQVPFFVWYGDKVPLQYKKIGRIPEVTQTTYLFPLVMKFMGLEEPIHYKSKEKKYLKLNLESINYNSLNN